MNAEALGVAGSTRTSARSPSVMELDRTRLLDLDQRQPVLVAEAPSGYGKTVLARSWVRHAPTECRCHWIPLNDEARDPIVFLERLAIALTGIKPTQRETILDIEADAAELFADIAERLASAQQPVWLVFDDVHCVAGSPSQHYLQRLLLGTGPSLRIFVTMQPLALDVSLGELSARGKVCWINAGALALTRDEVEALALLRNFQPTAQQVDLLARATQGWPALVQLALATPGGGPHLPSNIARLGPVREYIYERFLARLQPSERDLLWPLACVGSTPLPLLRVLSNSADAPVVALPRLVAMGIVQQEESDDDQSVHLHPVVSEAVLRVLIPERGSTKPKLLQTAANWFWDRGFGARAIRLLLEAGPEHLQLTRAWLIEFANSLNFGHGHHQTLIDLAEEWESAADCRDPDVDQAVAWALIFQRRFAAAEKRIDRVLVDKSNTAAEDEAQLQKAVMWGLRDDYDQAGALAHQWLKRHRSETSFKVGAASIVYGFHLKCAGDIVGARSALREAHQHLSAVQSAYGFAWAHVVDALCLIKTGHHRDALAEIERGIAMCGTLTGLGGHRAMLRSVEAFVRFERNEVALAREILDEALPLLPEQGVVDTILLGFATAARIRGAAGNLGAALDILSEGERLGQQREFSRLSLCLVAERALALIRSGAPGQARQAAEAAGLIPIGGESKGLHWDRASRLYARLALADGDSEEARGLLAPLVAHARAAKQRFKLCELLVLTALAEDQVDWEDRAFDTLQEALALASVEGYMRIFIDEGPELHALLRRWFDAQPLSARSKLEAAWAGQILNVLEGVPEEANPSGMALLQPLNWRERQILVLLDQGLTNAEIAARCFLVEGTVKWNLHNLYGKLGVRSRTAALQAARKLKLLKI